MSTRWSCSVATAPNRRGASFGGARRASSWVVTGSERRRKLRRRRSRAARPLPVRRSGYAGQASSRSVRDWRGRARHRRRRPTRCRAACSCRVPAWKRMACVRWRCSDSPVVQAAHDEPRGWRPAPGGSGTRPRHPRRCAPRRHRPLGPCLPAAELARERRQGRSRAPVRRWRPGGIRRASKTRRRGRARCRASL